MTPSATLTLGNLIRAEGYRKLIEWKKRWPIWLIGSVIIYSVGILCQQKLFGANGSPEKALEAMAAWTGYLSMNAGVAGELGRSRRNATIALVVSRNKNMSVLRNTFALATGELVLFVPAVLLLWICGCALTVSLINPVNLLEAGLLGLVTGLMFGPSVWALALFLRNESVLVAILGIGFFVWIGAASPAHTSFLSRILFDTSPLRLLYPTDLGALAVWSLFWLALGAASIQLGLFIIRLIREGGDLIADD